MPPLKSYLPADEAARLKEFTSRIEKEVAATQRVAKEFDEELYRLVVDLQRPVAAIARAAGMHEETMKKRVARIRRARAAVQHEAA